MPAAGRERFLVDERLFMVEDDRVVVVTVVKPTGMTPMPDLIRIVDEHGELSYRYPFGMWREAGPAEAVINARAGWLAAQRAHGPNSSEAESAREALRITSMAADQENPYLRRQR
jgi:hypothetical protein